MMLSFNDKIIETRNKSLKTERIHTLQVNITLRCNLECTHCHHEAGPDRNEMMAWDTMRDIIDLAGRSDVETIDITGGSPEKHPHLKRLISEVKEERKHVMVRTNIANLMEDEHKQLAEFFMENRVELIASLPCYDKDEVDCVRGKGVFEISVKGLQYLNSLGYGKDEKLKLNLVFNPMADFLPPSQAVLKAEYRKILKEDFGIDFTDLFTITNMPLGRFMENLKRNGKDHDYMNLLVDSFNPSTIDGLMCRYQINVAWDGTIYDCDFNQALGLPVVEGFKKNISELEVEDFGSREINTALHCYGCTAGSGSSCGGALLEK